MPLPPIEHHPRDTFEKPRCTHDAPIGTKKCTKLATFQRIAIRALQRLDSVVEAVEASNHLLGSKNDQSKTDKNNKSAVYADWISGIMLELAGKHGRTFDTRDQAFGEAFR